MGFKRTSEGRVFFQGAEEGNAAKKADFRNLQQTAAPQTTQLQILALLRSLNDKLKDAQTERMRMRSELDAYRSHIEELEDKLGKGGAGKSDRAEKIATDMFKELDKEIKETRKLILEVEDKTDKADKGVLTLQRQMVQAKALGEELAKQQTRYDELTKRVDIVDTRQEDLTGIVEKTSAEQARIARQIEKVAEDRARFMRKIERIEETVIQTRDALSAKAMVLLTEQGAQKAAASPAPGIVDQVMAARPTFMERPLPAEKPATRWQDSFVFQAGVAVMVLGLGVLGGWAVSKIRTLSNEMAPPAQELSTSALETESPAQNAEPETSAQTQTSTAEPDAPNTTAYYDSAAQDTNASSETFSASEETFEPPTASTQTTTAANDIGAIDGLTQEKLEKMLETNPDAVAAALNNIEPGTVKEPTEITETKTADAAPAIAAKQPAPAPEAVKTEAKETPAKKEAPVKTMERDASLPEQAKEIERQAFAGVPEAQHDLAAIYTAGQGGVKQNYERAAYWFRKAADQGIANASYNLGVLHHQGLGTKPDINQAISWYKKAATQGHPEAQYNLGIAYIEGIGVGYDPQKAADNFEKAASKGIVEAAYNLGLIYENGLLGAPQPDAALKWYKTAADRGNPEAKEALEQLAKNLEVRVEDVKRVADSVAPKQTAAPITKNSVEQLTRIQQKLMDEGLFPGPADGVGGALTEDAIRAYQMKHKLRADGKPSDELLRYMISK